MLELEEQFGPDTLPAIISLQSGEWHRMSGRARLTRLEADMDALEKRGFTRSAALAKLGYGHLAV